jgi:polyisoprenoid-binding protein YceI
MNLNILTLSALLASTVAVAGPKKIDPVKPFVNLDTSASYATWTGKKLAAVHTGKIRFKSGKFEFKKNTLSGGVIIADLSSITNDDLKDPGYNQKLIAHLKGEDFFDVAKHPDAKFTIRSASEIHNIVAGHPNVELNGFLSIRGVEKPFSAKVMMDPIEGGFEIKGKILIERTQFGLKYNSKKFFDVKELGDKLIDDQFELDLNLVAKR